MRTNDMDVAVVGLGCRFPAGIDTMDKLWRFIGAQGDATSDVPQKRWSIKRFYDPEFDTLNKTYMRRGSFLQNDIAEMDPLFFGISPREAAIMDPQQRILLEVVWEAFEDAGLIPSQVSGARTGVCIGTFSLDWLVGCGSPLNRTLISDHFAATAASATMLAARISHSFNFQGPSMSVDTACSSSLVAIHQACTSLITGESDVMVAGGVNLMLMPAAAITMSKGHFLSTDGRCKSFSADADGYGRGEGAGIVILKRLADAVRDGDVIHGVISGSGTNQDGRTLSLTMPSEAAQERLIRDVAQKADIALEDIAYVEAHGTGTPVGDPIEATALGRAIGQNRPKETPLTIGSIKANLGHLEAAAGVAGLMKALLCLRYGEIPAQANLNTLSTSIPFDDLNIVVPQKEAVPLHGGDKSLYVGVNSFGYGGTNAVALLRAARPEEQPATPNVHDEAHRPSGRFLLPINAQSETSLRGLAATYAEYLSFNNAISLSDMCFSAATQRSRLQMQAVVIADDKDTMIAALESYAKTGSSPQVVTGRRSEKETPSPVFVFSGMGSQWKGMGQKILQTLPNDVDVLIQNIDARFTEKAGWSILEEIKRPVAESRIDETVVAQPAIFLIQVMLSELYAHAGIRPSAVVGHSVGEVAAAYIGGALSCEDAISVIVHRSQQQARLAGRGTMLAVGLSAKDLHEKWLTETRENISLAAINSERFCTLAGDESSLKELAAQFKKEDIFHRFLKVEVPYHSAYMNEIQEDLQNALEGIHPKQPHIPLYSTVTGQLWDDTCLHDGAYWFSNAREPVLFHDALQAILHDGPRVFLEIGANPVLGSLIRETGKAVDGEVSVVSSLSRRDAEETAIARSVARLYIAGVPLDWRRLTAGQRTTLPHYVWSRSYFWSEAEQSRYDRLDNTVHPVLGMPVVGPRPGWVSDVNRNYMPWLFDHKVDGIILFPAAGYIEGALALHRQTTGTAQAILEDLEIGQALLLDSLTPPVSHWSFDDDSRVLAVSSAYGEGEDQEWITHAKVKILTQEPWSVARHGLDEWESDALIEVPVETFYAQLKEHGFAYGPAFQAIRTLKVTTGQAWSHLVLSDDLPHDEYLLHPSLLDGAFQSLIGAGYGTDEKRIYVPTGARQILYRGGKHRSLYAHAVLTRHSDKEIEGNIHLFTEDGESIAEVLGFRAQAIQQNLLGGSSRQGPRFYQEGWVETDELSVFAELVTVSAFGHDPQSLNTISELFVQKGLSVNAACLADHGPENIANALSHNPDIILYVGSDTRSDLTLTDLEGLLNLTNAIPLTEEGKTAPRLIVLTRGAVEADNTSPMQSLTQASLRGFSRGIASERPDLSLKLVDVGPSLDDTILHKLCAEILQDEAEDDIILRHDGRSVGRVMPIDAPPAPVPTLYQIDESTNDTSVGIHLECGLGGSLEKLHYQRFVCPEPQNGQVMFRTLSAALNFKDILKATGLVPDSVINGTFHGESLGMEASVEVVRVGPDVTSFKPGEQYVVSWPGCFASHFIADAQKIFALPLHGLGNPNEAATLPVAFITAYYGLCRLAQLSAGETVLIHAGTGGVGLAAIQLAQKIGARVFATAGSPEKRQYLHDLGCEAVWDSRSLAFADAARDLTEGRGVDVVLNSLAGEGQAHSLAVVAPYGRFVEIGKRDIIEKKGLSLAAFNENLSFFSLDLDRLMLTKPELMRSLLSDVADLLKNGSAAPLPYRAFPVNKTSDAFRFLASAKHIGKVVIDYTSYEDVKANPLPRPQPEITQEGAYLVTGGLSGFGFSVAEWLVSCGAQNLILLGRRTAEESGATERLANLSDAGINIRTFAVDVSDETAMNAVMHEITSPEAPHPLKGVFHCAGILDDALLQNMDIDRLQRVLRPKSHGAILLDRLTRGLKLDYFVLFSSVTTLLGNIGQSAYIAANTVLQAIAANRLKAGEAAFTIDWGAIADVGMLSRNEVAKRALAAGGLKGLDARTALETIPRQLTFGLSHLACVDIDWAAWSKVFPRAEELARFSLVRLAQESGNASARLAALTAMAEEERLPYVVEQVKVLIAQTLHLEPSSIDERSKLSELGIDSLAGVELQTALRVEFGIEISILVLARDESIGKMSQLLLNRINLGSVRRLP